MEVSTMPHLNWTLNRMYSSFLFLQLPNLAGEKEIEADLRPRYYHPKNRVKTPSYYPQTRLRHLTDRALISRLDLDQLFYIFYYREGTYEQYVFFYFPPFPSSLFPLLLSSYLARLPPLFSPSGTFQPFKNVTKEKNEHSLTTGGALQKN